MTVAAPTADARAFEREERRRTTSAATLAGILGGVLLALWVTLYSAGVGLGFWTPVHALAAVFWGVEALFGGFFVVLVGVAWHVLMSAVLGALFGALLPPRASTGTTFWTGIGYGLVVLAVMAFLILPWADEVLRVRMELNAWSWIIGHLIFGATLAMTPALRDRLRRREHAPDAAPRAATPRASAGPIKGPGTTTTRDI